jgi:hypothetical protein
VLDLALLYSDNVLQYVVHAMSRQMLHMTTSNHVTCLQSSSLHEGGMHGTLYMLYVLQYKPFCVQGRRLVEGV